MKRRTQVVIIGAGAIGLGVAWQLARRGLTDVVVVDRNHLNFGATARNGGGVRAQWTTAANIELAKESIRRFDRLSQELGHNLFWRQGGYLFVARQQHQMKALERSVAFQNEHGVRTRLIDPDACRKVLPALDSSGAGVLGGAFNTDDATLFPWPLVWGYYEQVRRMGVEVHPFTTVSDVETDPSDGSVKRVVTDRGTIECDWVVNATGSWVNEIGRMVGIELPVRPERHEIMVTEPMKPFLPCMLVDMTTGLYSSQSSRGEIVAGISEARHAVTMDWASTPHFLTHIARTMTTLMPKTRGVSVLRQWAGSYDMTPDAKPIIEAHEEVPGYVTCAGFSGHGIMISPVCVEIVADLVMGRTPRYDVERFRSARFLVGPEPGDQETMVIG